jgi:hypothetical protein
VILRFPEIAALLRRHQVNLTTVDQVAGILSDGNKDHVLRTIRGKSEREVRAVVETYRPPMALRDRVRSVNVRVPASERSVAGSARVEGRANTGVARGVNAGAGNEDPGACEKSNYSRSGSVPSGSLFGGAGLSETVIEKRVHIEFLARPEFMTKYNEAKAIVSNAYSNASFETVLEAVLDYYLARRSPERRMARGREKAAGKPSTPQPPRSAFRNGKRSRCIPAAIRDQVFARDGSRCTFVGTTGKRCSETERLEIDHVKPFARGGTNDAANLRLLCRAHNRLAAEREFGQAHMGRYQRID